MSTADEVRKLYDLLQSGALTQGEFDAEKARVLRFEPLTRSQTPESASAGRWTVTLFDPQGEQVQWLEGPYSAASLAARAAVEAVGGRDVEECDYGWRSADGEYAALIEEAESPDSLGGGNFGPETLDGLGMVPVAIVEELRRFGKLTDDGYLSPSEFEVQRAALLSLQGPIAPSMLTSEQLSRLARLVKSGVISREDFENQKPPLLWTDTNAAPPNEAIPAPDEVDVGAPAIPTGWEWMLILAALMVAIGSLLPWEQASSGLVSITRNGFQLGPDLSFSADGLVVMGLGFLAAVIGVTRLTGRSYPQWVINSPILLGGGILWESIGDERSLASTVRGLRVAYPNDLYSVGYGVWLVIIGGAIIALAGLAGWWGTSRFGGRRSTT